MDLEQKTNCRYTKVNSNHSGHQINMTNLVKLQQDCSYHGEALNDPTAF